MKANELMIGDWVWYSNQPYQIRELGIFGENRDGDDYPAVCIGKPNGIGLILERNEIEPIPLTPEILEKNNWKSYSHENTPIFGIIQGFEIVLAWMDYYWQLCIDGTIYRKIKIRYVHDLQHALKLCGIEKTVEP